MWRSANRVRMMIISVAVDLIAALIRIRVVPDSNLGWSFFEVFAGSFQEKAVIIREIN
jgi:hypothetical protein